MRYRRRRTVVTKLLVGSVMLISRRAETVSDTIVWSAYWI